MASSLSVAVLLCLAAAAAAQLSPTFYDTSCPRALATIKSAVTAAVNNEPRMGASLLRLHFHDCFVQARFHLTNHPVFFFYFDLMPKSSKQVCLSVRLRELAALQENNRGLIFV
jgi:hypothetical protein